MRHCFFYLIFLVLLASCGNFSDNPADMQPQTIVNPDSLWTTTGNEKLDSLLQLAAVAPQDTNLARLYYNIGEMYEDNDFELAKTYYLKLSDLSEYLNWREGQYLYTSVFASLLIREGLTDSALIILQEAYQLALNENNEGNLANIIFSKGNAYFVKEWYETALAHYMEALSIYEKINDSQKIQQLYYMMAQLYLSIDAVEKAIEYGENSVAMNSENPPALAALAMAYSSAHQYEKAKGYYDEALRLTLLQNNNYLTGLIYFHIANDALFAFDLERAEKFAEKSLEINREFGDAVFFTDLILLSKLEQVKGNYFKSEIYALEALQIAVDLDALKEIRLCYMILSELAIAQGKYRENIQYWEESNLIEIALAKETMLSANEEMEAKYQVAKKELEIENQQRIIARQNMQRWFFVACVAVFILISVLLWYMLQLRQRRNVALAEMNATKDKFFSIISHDLKNPAVSLRDALNMLIKNAHSWDTNMVDNYYNELLKSAEGQVELIYNLLGWAQIQTERVAFKPATFSFSFLDSDLSIIRKMAETKGINLVISIPDNVLVTGDCNMIATIIRNLMINAIKFTSEGGQITLSIEPTADQKHIVSISDTGIGMNREELHRIFSLENTHSRKGTAGEQGSGLGLIVCKELLEKHGSTLFVESENEKGSRFWFVI